MGHGPAVHGKKNAFSAAVIPERHIVRQPALDAAPLVVIASGALSPELLSGPEPIHVEVPHVITDLLEIFDQFVVGHGLPF